MKNKTWIILCAVVVVILAVLLVWKPFGAKAAESEPAAEAASEQNLAAGSPAQSVSPTPEKTDEEEAEEEEEWSAYVLEDQGELEIVIPEDQDSDGF
ncbi:MAG: hypothetical protein IJK03_07545 [Oscillospiraceae bacterium]|nr:hypothetical protein [Oscillospiraceae bacterium]